MLLSRQSSFISTEYVCASLWVAISEDASVAVDCNADNPLSCLYCPPRPYLVSPVNDVFGESKFRRWGRSPSIVAIRF